MQQDNEDKRPYGRSLKNLRYKRKNKKKKAIKKKTKPKKKPIKKKLVKRKIKKKPIKKKIVKKRKIKPMHTIDNSKKYILGIDNGEKGAWAVVTNNKIVDICEFPESFNEFADFIIAINAELRQIAKNKDIPSSETKYKELTKNITALTKQRNKYPKSSEEFRILDVDLQTMKELRNIYNKRKRLKAKKKALEIKRQYHCNNLYNFIKKYAHDIKYAVIEQPIRQSAMGLTADVLVKSGEIYGINTCILQLHDVKLFQVSPKQWQQQYEYVMPPKDKDDKQYLQKRRKAFKEQSIQFCKNIYKNADSFIKGGTNKDNDNIAEACLIAKYNVENLKTDEENDDEQMTSLGGSTVE